MDDAQRINDIVLVDGGIYKWHNGDALCVLLKLRSGNWGMWNTQWGCFFSDIGDVSTLRMKESIGYRNEVFGEHDGDAFTYICTLQDILMGDRDGTR